MSIANELVNAIHASSKSSSRSKQKSIGPSEIGGCRRAVYMRYNDYEATNETIVLPAVMGTAIHEKIQRIFRHQDPWEDRFFIEREFKSEDGSIIGHVDMYDAERKEIIDWKTTKKSNLAYFPSVQQRWQVQVYGWLVSQSGLPVDNVTLVAIPRDGDERDIVYHTEPYNLEIVREALLWLEGVKTATEPPAPEKDAWFCKSYCKFFDATGERGCTGRPKAEAEGATIDDNQIALAAQAYLEINEQLSELEKEKESIKALLEGVNGVTEDGIKIYWSVTAGRKTIDEDEVAKALGYVPKKVGRESARLIVKGQ